MDRLSRNIMRRTYYAFAIHWLTRPIVRFMVPTLLVGYIVAKLVFVAAVLANAQQVGLSHLPSFAYGALIGADLVSLIAVIVLGYLSLRIVRDVLVVLILKERFA